MAIAKLPSQKNKIEIEAEAFINKERKENASERVRVMMRFDKDLLKKIDELAKRRGVTRTAWIQFTLSRAIENDVV